MEYLDKNYLTRLKDKLIELQFHYDREEECCQIYSDELALEVEISDDGYALMTGYESQLLYTWLDERGYKGFTSTEYIEGYNLDWLSRIVHKWRELRKFTAKWLAEV